MVTNGEIQVLKQGVVAFARAVIKEDLKIDGNPKGEFSNAAIYNIRLQKGLRERDDFYHLVFYAFTSHVYVFACLNQDLYPSSTDKFKLLCHHDSAWSSDGMEDLRETLMEGNYMVIVGQEGVIRKIKNFKSSGRLGGFYSVDTYKRTIKEIKE